MYQLRNAWPWGSAATMAPGCGVDATVSVRTRSGCAAATAHATAPPQSWPSRSNRSAPAASARARTSPTSAGKAYAETGRGRAPGE